MEAIGVGYEKGGQPGVTPVFQGEVQLAAWNESHTGGAKVTFWLPDPEDLAVFKALTIRKGNRAGHRFACVLVEIGDNERAIEPKGEVAIAADAQVARLAGESTAETNTTPAKGVTNRLAQWLMVSGYFRAPQLWAAVEAAGIYSQDEHKKWIERQPCCGPKHKAPGTCTGDVVLHHCRNAANAGKGIKPPHWYGVPLCGTHHVPWIHATAERADMHATLERAVGLTADRMKAVMKRTLGIESLRDIDAEMLESWEAGLGITLAPTMGAPL